MVFVHFTQHVKADVLENCRMEQSSSFSSKLYPEPLETQVGADFTLKNE